MGSNRERGGENEKPVRRIAGGRLGKRRGSAGDAIESRAACSRFQPSHLPRHRLPNRDFMREMQKLRKSVKEIKMCVSQLIRRGMLYRAQNMASAAVCFGGCSGTQKRNGQSQYAGVSASLWCAARAALLFRLPTSVSCGCYELTVHSIAHLILELNHDALSSVCHGFSRLHYRVLQLVPAALSSLFTPPFAHPPSSFTCHIACTILKFMPIPLHPY